MAYCNGKTHICDLADCAHAHSVRLMDEIERALQGVNLTASACDFFAVVVGAGSFTGIRIGISTVKGLCAACDKPALSLTSFDTIAYSEEGEKVLALVDAGHGAYYACGYTQGEVTYEPRYCSLEEVSRLIAEGYEPRAGEQIPLPCKIVNSTQGLLCATLKKSENLCSAKELNALYLRKSSAEENLK